MWFEVQHEFTLYTSEALFCMLKRRRRQISSRVITIKKQITVRVISCIVNLRKKLDKHHNLSVVILRRQVLSVMLHQGVDY